MVIYIEQVLIDNFIINFFIILTMSYIFKAKLKKANIILSSLLGSIIALITPLFNFNLLYNIFTKIILSLTMVAILKRFKKFKEYLIFYFSFLLITFLFGGACLFLLTTFDKTFNPNNYYSYNLPIGVIIVFVFFLTNIIKGIFKNVYKRKNVSSFIYKIRIYNNNKTDEILAYLDSGNFLTDSLTNKPITIIDFNSLKNILNEISITDILLNKTNKLNNNFKNVHLMNVSSIGNSSKILVLEVEKIEVYIENEIKTIENACVGLTIKSFVNDLGYNALLSPQLF